MRSDRKLYGLEASLAYCRVFLDTIEGEDKGNVYTNEIVINLLRWAETNIENISYLSGVKIGPDLGGEWSGFRILTFNYKGIASLREKQIKNAIKFLQKYGYEVAIYYK